jgi:hypothetical protein
MASSSTATATYTGAALVPAPRLVSRHTLRDSSTELRHKITSHVVHGQPSLGEKVLGLSASKRCSHCHLIFVCKASTIVATGHRTHGSSHWRKLHVAVEDGGGAGLEPRNTDDLAGELVLEEPPQLLAAVRAGIVPVENRHHL